MHLLPHTCHNLKIGINSLSVICQLELQLIHSKKHKYIILFSTTYFGKKSRYQVEHKIKKRIYIYIYAVFVEFNLKPSQNNRINCVLTEFIVILISEQNKGVKLS